jgi:hypothetical protein
MAVRQKISFAASRAGMTITELILTTIKKTFDAMVEERSIIIPKQIKEREDRLYIDLVQSKDNSLKAIMMNIIMYNAPLKAELRHDVVK